MSLHRPEGTAQAQAAYTTWCARQDDDDPAPWEDLPATEQDAWRRAVRLLAVLGREEET